MWSLKWSRLKSTNNILGVMSLASLSLLCKHNSDIRDELQFVPILISEITPKLNNFKGTRFAQL